MFCWKRGFLKTPLLYYKNILNPAFLISLFLGVCPFYCWCCWYSHPMFFCIFCWPRSWSCVTSILLLPFPRVYSWAGDQVDSPFFLRNAIHFYFFSSLFLSLSLLLLRWVLPRARCYTNNLHLHGFRCFFSQVENHFHNVTKSRKAQSVLFEGFRTFTRPFFDVVSIIVLVTKSLCLKTSYRIFIQNNNSAIWP